MPDTNFSNLSSTADLEAVEKNGVMTVSLKGRYDSHTVAGLWRRLIKIDLKKGIQRIEIDASGIAYCDGTGLAFLSALLEKAEKRKIEIHLSGLPGQLEHLYSRFDRKKLAGRWEISASDIGLISSVGKMACDFCQGLYNLVWFLGKLFAAGLSTLRHPRQIRWRDFLYLLELVGVNAVGISLLLGCLFGLIMAFSSAMPLRQFGVEVYVSDLVAIALVRVLGPFITAIIVAGRTGSAFAAEIGTMKINNEIDALQTMGLEPVRFLVVPRVLSAAMMAPLLSVLVNLAGLAGSAAVILSLGYGFNTYYAHVDYILDYPDVLIGLSKSLVFGGLIGAIGCLRGLQTESGAGAVGISTTRAVVSSIVAIVAAEGIFSVLLYILDI